MPSRESGCDSARGSEPSSDAIVPRIDAVRFFTMTLRRKIALTRGKKRHFSPETCIILKKHMYFDKKYIWFSLI